MQNFNPSDFNPHDWPLGYLEGVRDFLSGNDKREQGKDICEEAFSSGWLFPLQRKGELARMMQIGRTLNPLTICEIGTDKGAGVYQWLQCLPTVKHMIAIEPRGMPYSEMFMEAFPGVAFSWHHISSYAPETVASVSYFFNSWKLRGIDVLFIDGDKTKFLTDFNLYLPLMTNPSVIFMHDINVGIGERGTALRNTPRWAFEEVKKMTSERGTLKLRSSFPFRTEEIFDISDTADALTREKMGIECSCPHEQWLRHWRGASCGVGVIYV